MSIAGPIRRTASTIRGQGAEAEAGICRFWFVHASVLRGWTEPTFPVFQYLRREGDARGELDGLCDGLCILWHDRRDFRRRNTTRTKTGS